MATGKPHDEEEIARKAIEETVGRIREQARQGIQDLPAGLRQLAQEYRHLGPRAAALLQDTAWDFVQAPDMLAEALRKRLERDLLPEDDTLVIEGEATISGHISQEQANSRDTKEPDNEQRSR